MSELTQAVRLERDGDVAVLTMQFAPHNLISAVLLNALIASLAKAHSSGCRAAVLRSSLRHFSAGADLALFQNGGANFVSKVDMVAALRAFEEAPIPIVASVHGAALGGGFELALACDMIVAASSAKFGLVEATLGLHPLMGGIQRMVDRVGAARAKEFVMLARRHDSATLERWGVINRVVPDLQLRETTMTIAHELARGPTIAHGCTKRMVNVYLREGMQAADNAMQEIQAPIWQSEDLKRGLAAFAQKGPGNAVFSGN
ncbi:MAG: enoyl-CoA hydratase/isomerase family protein [Burkholderiales bacterium]